MYNAFSIHRNTNDTKTLFQSKNIQQREFKSPLAEFVIFHLQSSSSASVNPQLPPAKLHEKKSIIKTDVVHFRIFNI